MTATVSRPRIDPRLAPSRAARGAAWFDEHRDKWWSPIDLKTFNVANSSECPLAWAYGDYQVGLGRMLKLMGDPDNGYTILCDMGFDAPLGPDAERAKYHVALQVAWVKEIVDRQNRRRN